jgi:hypothetical protein
VKLVPATELGVQLCEAIGLDPNRVQQLRIMLEPGSIARVEADVLFDVEVEGAVEQFIKTHIFQAAEAT